MPILYLYILTALIAVGLCTLAGFFVCGIFKLTLCWKKRTLRESSVMDHNKSYQVAPFKFNIPVIPDSEALTTTQLQECYA